MLEFAVRRSLPRLATSRRPTSSARTRRRHDARRPERRATEVRHPAGVSSDEPAAKRSLGGLFPRRTARRASVSPSRFVPVVPLGTALTRSTSDHRACRVLERLQSSDVALTSRTSRAPDDRAPRLRRPHARPATPRVASAWRARTARPALREARARARAALGGEPAGSGARRLAARGSRRGLRGGQNAASKPAKAKPARRPPPRAARRSRCSSAKPRSSLPARRGATSRSTSWTKPIAWSSSRARRRRRAGETQGRAQREPYNRLLRESRELRARAARARRRPRRRARLEGRSSATPPPARASQYARFGRASRPLSVEGSGDRHAGHTTTEDEGGVVLGRPPSQRMPGRRTRTTIGGARAAARRTRGGRAARLARRGLSRRSRRRTKRTPTPPRFPTWVPTRLRDAASAPLVPRARGRRAGRGRRVRGGGGGGGAKRRPSRRFVTRARIVPEARAAASEDERPADDETSRFDSEDDEDSFSSDVASLTLGSEDSFASASLGVARRSRRRRRRRESRRRPAPRRRGRRGDAP